jgi:hypothetical protein
MLREWISAVLFAVILVVFAIGVGLMCGVSAALMVGAALAAAWTWAFSAATDVDETVNVEAPVAAAAKRNVTTAAQTPAEMMAALPDDDGDDGLE